MAILNKLKKTIFFILMIIYMETIFAVFAFEQFPLTIVFIILFSIPIGIIFDLITSCFSKKVNKVISYIITILICILFIAHFVYNKIYKSIISIYSFKNGSQVFQFYETIAETIKNNILAILLLVLPIVALIILHKFKKVDFEKSNIKESCIKLILLVLMQTIAILTISLGKDEDIYSNKNIYYNSNSLIMTARKFGVFTAMRLDIKNLIFNNDVEKTAQVVNRIMSFSFKEIDENLEYNQLDIDFNTLAENEKNPKISVIHKYMETQLPSEKNEYTGIFEGKNLVVIVGESFSNIGIREDITPTLYKLSNEGFDFRNFYTPLFPVSTADGEYMTDTSLLPKEGVWSISAIRNNYIPYSYANVLKKLGYSANAYHDYTSTYYDRDKYIPAMGYDSFLAVNTGLEKRMDTKEWTPSDLEMMQVTTNDYINNEKFLAYYMTVSGHLGYTRDGNVIADKNWDLVEDLPYSERAKGYLATQIELDRAVEYLINTLKETGKLEDTVIVISGDHYPYGLELEEINEISTYERDDTFEIYNMPLIIWNSEMEESIVVEKIGTSIDILPTVLNLFGAQYDSRLLMGRDILSDSEPLVILSDRSFITDKGKYNSITDEFETTSGEEVDDEYIDRIKTIIEGKMQISKMILEQDYYKSIREYIEY